MNKLAEIWEEMPVWMMADGVVAWIWGRGGSTLVKSVFLLLPSVSIMLT